MRRIIGQYKLSIGLKYFWLFVPIHIHDHSRCTVTALAPIVVSNTFLNWMISASTATNFKIIYCTVSTNMLFILNILNYLIFMDISYLLYTTGRLHYQFWTGFFLDICPVILQEIQTKLTLFALNSYFSSNLFFTKTQ